MLRTHDTRHVHICGDRTECEKWRAACRGLELRKTPSSVKAPRRALIAARWLGPLLMPSECA